MKRPLLTEDFIPVGKFKAKASQVINSVKMNGRSVVITQSGEPVAVLITPADFDKYVSDQGVVTAVQEGINDYNAGRIVEDSKLDEILEKHIKNTK